MRTVLLLLVGLWLTPLHAEEPAIAGAWILNEEESDDAEKALERVMPERDRKAGRYRRTPRIGRNPDADKVTLERLVLSDSDLTITIDGARVAMDYGNRGRRTLFTDGRGQSVSALDGVDTGPGYSFGIWDGGKLLIESRKQRGMILYESFRLGADSDTLLHEITVSVPAAGESVDVHRTYTRAPSAAPGP